MNGDFDLVETAALGGDDRFSTTGARLNGDARAVAAGGAVFGDDDTIRHADGAQGSGSEFIDGDAEIVRGTLRGGAGEDTLLGGLGADSIVAGAGDDRVEDGAGLDTVRLGSGDDTLRADGPLLNIFDGGSGTDFISFFGFGDGIEAYLGSGVVNRFDDPALDGVMTGFERISGSNAGSDSLYGSGADEEFRSNGGGDFVDDGGGDDLVLLGAGDDVVFVGGGRDTLDGGAGQDTIDYSGSVGGVRIDLVAQTVSGGRAGGDVISGFEGAFGSAVGTDRMLGDGADNLFDGRGGDDRLFGRAGADSLYGGAGEDFLDGGPGDDLLVGDGGADAFQFDVGEGNDTLADFENDLDEIELVGFAALFTTVSGALDIQYAEESGGNVVLDYGAAGTLTILNASISELGNDLVLL